MLPSLTSWTNKSPFSTPSENYAKEGNRHFLYYGSNAIFGKHKSSQHGTAKGLRFPWDRKCSWKKFRGTLGPFHTARVMPASALILRAHPRKGILLTQRGPSQTNCYCLQWSLSHGASAGHRPCAGEMQRRRPFGWSSTRACAKVLWDIAFNAHLHPHHVKRIPLPGCALNISADAGITCAM